MKVESLYYLRMEILDMGLPNLIQSRIGRESMVLHIILMFLIH